MSSVGGQLQRADSGDVARVRDKMEQIARDVIPTFR
jgi:hypothetical protein